jgi:hypothetical protein
MRKSWAFGLFATAALTGCAGGGDRIPDVTASAETAATTQSDANTALVIPSANGGLIIGSSESGGIELYDLTGARRAAAPAGSVVGVDARANGSTWTVAALDGATNRLRLFDVNVGTASTTERAIKHSTRSRSAARARSRST